MRHLALCGAVLILALPALSQATKVQDVVSGKDTPPTLHLKDLNSEWRRLTIAVQGGSGGAADLMNQIMPLAMMGSNGPKSKDDFMGLVFLSSMFGGGGGGSQPVFYTKGQTSVFGGESFLVAYKLEKPQIDFMQLVTESAMNGGKEPDMAKLMSGSKVTGDSPLTLSLVNVKSIATMSGIRPFDLAQEIADSSKGPGGLLEMLMSRAATEQVKPATAESKPVSKPAPTKKGSRK